MSPDLERTTDLDVPTVREGKSYTFRLIDGEVAILPPATLRSSPIKLDVLEAAVEELRAAANGSRT